MDMPVNVPVDNPNADTEWYYACESTITLLASNNNVSRNDILRKHGVIPEKPPSPTPVIEEALLEAKRLAHENRLEGKDLEELAELEDEEDDGFLNEYRQKRLTELKTISSASVHNQVYPLQKPDYAREVTEASRSSFVLVLLISSQGTNVESQLLIEVWRELAARFGDIKFCQIRADMCIEGYPEKNTPTVLIYRDGDIKKQIVTLRELQGIQTSTKDMERVLVSVGAIHPRLQRQGEDQYPGHDEGQSRGAIRQTRLIADEGDSDWE
ncbi:MAG: hypothetical protein M1821_005159 [Bathelium mastoideum]|nr:MAG: hypothetical protein M1821_005159 [Bathelium mastoideum]KAI9677811.1 MAG: hypothetical protein M1822_008123 [Bathelium mastoideum]